MSNHDQYSLRIALADSDADILASLPVLRQWRPEIGREGDFAARVRHLQERGYRLMAVWQGDRVVACAGYGLAENLIRGRYLHINELVTAWSVRSTGIGQRLLQRDPLLQALIQEARNLDCQALLLECGLRNSGAHKFYFREGLRIAAFRFAIDFDDFPGSV